MTTAILVPQMGHTRILPGFGTVSKYTKDITNARSLIARDALELRRVYQVPNKANREVDKN